MMSHPLRDLREVLRDGALEGPRVLGALASGPKTIPEIAQELRCPPREALLWVMELRRFGRVVDVPKAPGDEFYRYRRVEGSP